MRKTLEEFLKKKQKKMKKRLSTLYSPFFDDARLT